MEDRYLFKAKRIDNGEWVQGNLVWSDDTDDDYKAVIIPTTNSNMFTRGGIISQKRAEALDVAIQALEKQIEMKKYCDENSCADCPYHNTSLKDNRCMNDFIIEKE